MLLAALLLHANTPVALEALVETVWDASPPPGAAGTLRSYVRRLRLALGETGARIEARDPGYLIRVTSAELDVLEFERLCRAAEAALREGAWRSGADAADEALGFWRGHPLLDVPSQPLRDAVVPKLERLRVQALEDRITAGLNLGWHERLIADLHGLVAAYPLRERLREQLMLALYRSGRQAEALAAYQDARTMLVTELGIEPGPELKSLHTRILAADADLAAPPVSVDSALSSTPVTAVPRQLPAAPRHFTGRQGELELIIGLRGPSQPTIAPGSTAVISTIDGMAGVGKTALAIHAAHLLAESFPDGQLFIDLHGYTQGHRPRAPAQALSWLLQALGVPVGQIPLECEQAAALYRQRLDGTRTLIVLDNAATAAQVRPLLPGGGSCLVLVTSRRRLKGLDDAYTLSLDLLPAEDAVALLRAMAEAGRAPAGNTLLGEVAELCGYLPLALRIAAALLRHRPAWSLEHLAGLLRDERHRLSALSDGERELAGVFDLSYASLDEQHRCLWRSLGLIPGPDLDAYAAAALLRISPAIASGLLEDLVDHNLLSEYVPGRYQLHDLLRVRARDLAAADPEREAAVDRLLHYYAHTAQSASVLIARYPRCRPIAPAPDHAPVIPDPDTARTWLRTEQPNLDAGFTHALTHGLDTHAIALAAGLAEILQADGPFIHALEIRQSAAEIAERSGHPAAHANALTDLARMGQVTGDYPGADAALTRALEIYRAHGNRLGEANALTDLGKVRSLTGDFAGAGVALTHGLEIYRAHGNRLGEANALADLGKVRYITGDYPGADAALTHALEICRALSHYFGEANALLDLGKVRYLTRNYPGAISAINQALDIHRAHGNRLGEANALANLGKVRCVTGYYPEAGDALTRALEIYRMLNHRLGEANALTELGRVRHLTGDFQAADAALTHALEIYRALEHRSNESWALNYHAATLAATGRRPLALTLYQRALAMNRELNKPDDEAISLEGIAEHHLATGDPAQGIAHLRQALEIYQRLGMAPDAQRVQDSLSHPASA